MFGGNELILEANGLIEGVLEDGVERRGEIHAGLHVGSLRQGGQQAIGFGDDGIGLNAALFEDGADNALLLLGERDQQMQRVHHLAAVLFGQHLALLQGVLGLLS